MRRPEPAVANSDSWIAGGLASNAAADARTDHLRLLCGRPARRLGKTVELQGEYFLVLRLPDRLCAPFLPFFPFFSHFLRLIDILPIQGELFCVPFTGSALVRLHALPPSAGWVHVSTVGGASQGLIRLPFLAAHTRDSV